MPTGVRYELEPAEIQLLMQALFNSELDGAAELHDNLTQIGTRFNPDWRWTISAFRTDGEDA